MFHVLKLKKMKRERDCPPYNDETPEEFMLSQVFGLEVTQEQIDKRRQKLEDQKPLLKNLQKAC